MTTTTRPRAKRPRMPELVLRDLWARAAGRCEFRGCNKLLNKDALTQQNSNLAKISHIIAWSPDGPRGHPVDSLRLAKDISNLMLTCWDHGKIIDDLDKVEEYSVERLRAFKWEHEDRVRRLTAITEEAKTHVLILQANIGERRVRINREHVRNAVLPMYPTNEEGYEIDLTETMLGEHDKGFWELSALDLERRVSGALLRSGARGGLPNHVSVFALAPIPLLVKFGTLLGDINEIEVFQKHRTGSSWTWLQDDGTPDGYYSTVEHDAHNGATRVALMVSVSSQVHFDQVQASMGGECAAYEIVAREPSQDFLRSRERLNLFGYEYRKLLAAIRQRHKRLQELHLFAAAPAPVAILCGQSLSQKIDPPMFVYEYYQGGYVQALAVNQQEETKR